MGSIAQFLKRKGYPDIDVSILRDAIRSELANAALLGPIPCPEISKFHYKPPGDVGRTAMDELTDRIREAVNAYNFPCELFNSIVKQVVSSDASDKRRKARRAAAAEDKGADKVRLALAQTLKVTSEQSGSQSAQAGSWSQSVGVYSDLLLIPVRTQNIHKSTAVATSTNESHRQAAKMVDKTEVVRLDEAFVFLNIADIKNSTAAIKKTTAAIEMTTADLEVLIKEEQLSEARTRHAIALFLLNQAIRKAGGEEAKVGERTCAPAGSSAGVPED